MRNYNIKAALFDLDGVIVFTDKYHYLAWKQLSDEQGWDFNETVNNRLRGIPRLASLEEILKHNNIDLPLEEKIVLMNRKNDYYVKLLEQINPGDIYPGSVEFLKKLRARGILISLCSSSKNAPLVLDKLGLTDLFDAVVTGHDIKNAKPDPEIFLLGAKRLNMPAFHCVVFEDAKAGIEGARAAKMKTVGVGNKEETEKIADTFIMNYEEIDVDTFLESGRKQPLPVHETKIIETEFNPYDTGHIESVFALGNGYIGLRGTYDETDEGNKSLPGMYLNGIFTTREIHHAFPFPLHATHDQFTINLSDWRIFNLFIDGEKACFSKENIKDHRRELDMVNGVIERSFVFETSTGKKAQVKSLRMVNMAEVHGAQVQYSVTPLNFDGEVVIQSEVVKLTGTWDVWPCVLASEQDTDGVYSFIQEVTTTKQRVATAVAHTFDGASSVTTENAENCYTTVVSANLKQGATVTVSKYVAFSCTMDKSEDMEGDARRLAATNRDAGMEVLAARQAAFWKKHWENGDIIVEGNPADQQAIRYSLFQLRQQLATINQSPIGATGLSGLNYSGKAFWDTEMYLMPYYNFTDPASQKELILYRYKTLPRARERAKEYGLCGAMYPWCGIDGEETSVVFEASTAEYHLHSDIAYSIWRYYDSTLDKDFVYDYGAEIVFETAKFMAHRGNFIDAYDGRFCLNVVCGPDEYSCGVNNNMYTNFMLRFHLRFALRLALEMKQEAPEKYAALIAKIDLTEEELDRWQQAADKMYYRYNEKLGVHEQDDTFVYNDPLDMDTIPKNFDIRGMFHPLDLWRYQVSKQADVVLLNFIQGDEFTFEEKLRDYDYYEPKCNHGSSLSAAIHAIMAAELGKPDAYEFFRQTAYMDISDFKHNTDGGVHIACMGGVWMTVVNGFLGMRHYVDGLLFNPHMPEAWKSYTCRLAYRGALMEITVNAAGATFTLLDGESLSFRTDDEKVTLTKAAPVFTCKVK